MTRPRRTSVGAVIGVGSALLLVAAAGLGILAAAHDAPGYGIWFETSVNGVAFTVVGAVLTRRRPANPVSWLFAAMGLLAALQLSLGQWAQDGYAGLLPGAGGAAFVSAVILPGWVIPLVGTLLVLFPDGRPPGRAWVWLPAVAALLGVVDTAALALSSGAYEDFAGHSGPLGIDSGLVPALKLLTNVLMFVVLGGAVVSTVLRWRTSHGERRQQLKPFLLAAGLWPIAFVVILFTPLQYSVVWPHVIFGVTVAGMTAGAAVSVLRYRLYDIDRVVSRAVSYVVVTGLLLGVYAACVALMTEALPFSSAFGTAASTLAAAALFHPLRRRVQLGVDQRFNRAKYDALGTVDAFSGRLRDQVDVDLVRADLVAVVARSVQPAHVSLWAPDAG